MTVEPGWAQGRGAFGGLVIGTLVRAAVVAVGDASRIVRSVTAELVGPVVVGEATLHLDRLRQGAGVSAVRVRLVAPALQRWAAMAVRVWPAALAAHPSLMAGVVAVAHFLAAH
jgi:hypothetical protein